jgi:phage gpG-like protein
MFTVTVTDSGVIDAFNRLIAFGENTQPVLAAIGEKMLEFTKERFEQSNDPYGNPWEPNSDTTLRAALHRSGKNFTKKGGLSKRGADLLAGKKPLIGASKSLSTQLHAMVIGDNLVTVSSTMIYAATQQFGARQGEFGRDKRNHPIPWGDIPARPFFPDPAQGLPEELQQDIADVLRIAIQNAMHGT